MWNIDEMQYSSNLQKNKETVLYVILPINPSATMLQGSSQWGKNILRLYFSELLKVV